jgi:addiction module HigA family antidote
MQMFNPPHPGEVLKDALGCVPMTLTEFAAYIGVARSTLSRVLNGRAGITPEMSIRLSSAFGQPSKDIWFKMQNDYDFWQATQGKPGRIKVRPLKIAA